MDSCGALRLDARRPRAPLLLMSYLNPLLAYGLEQVAGGCGARRRRRASSFPICRSRSAPTCAPRSLRSGLALVQFVTPVTPVERMQMLCAASSGFVYAVTMTGTTGKNVAVPPEVLEYFARVKRVSPLPVCAGFGIRSREQVERLAPHVDGVIVGSALVEVLERGEDPAAFLRSLRVSRAEPDATDISHTSFEQLFHCRVAGTMSSLLPLMRGTPCTEYGDSDGP